MKKILILLLFPVLCFGQGGYYNDNKSDVSQICDIYKGNSFTSNLEAENALQKIIQVSGISKRFVLHSCSNIDNCIATTIKGINQSDRKIVRVFFDSVISGSHPTKSFPNFPNSGSFIFTEQGNDLIRAVGSKIYSIDKGEVFTTNELGNVILVE